MGDSLPMEMIIEIGSYLAVKDILNCILVSRHWRNSLNANKIWSRLCLENYDVKTDLSPLITKPCQVDPPFSLPISSDNLSHPCPWWIRYMQETRIANNFRHDNFKEDHLRSYLEIVQIFDDSIFCFSHKKLEFESWTFFPLTKIHSIPIGHELFLIPYHDINENGFLYIEGQNLTEISNDKKFHYYQKLGCKYEHKISINLSENLRNAYGPPCCEFFHCENGFFVFFCTFANNDGNTQTFIHSWDLENFTQKTAEFLPDLYTFESFKISKSKLFFINCNEEDQFFLNSLDLNTSKFETMVVHCGTSIPAFIHEDIVFISKTRPFVKFAFVNIFNANTSYLPLNVKSFGFKIINPSYIAVLYKNKRNSKQVVRLINCKDETKHEEEFTVEHEAQIDLSLTEITKPDTLWLFDFKGVSYVYSLQTKEFIRKIKIKHPLLVKGTSKAVVHRKGKLCHFW